MKHISSDSVEILNALKAAYSVHSDKALAEHLGVAAGFISRIRSGTRFFSRSKMLEIERFLQSHDVFITSKSVDLDSHQFIENSPQESILKFKVLSQAAGFCELCKGAAPFLDKDGIPYLKVTYIQPASRGGIADMSNLAALCPNCFAKLEVLQKPEDMTTLIALKSDRK